MNFYSFREEMIDGELLKVVDQQCKMAAPNNANTLFRNRKAQIVITHPKTKECFITHTHLLVCVCMSE